MKKIEKNKNENEFFNQFLSSIPENVKNFIRLSSDIVSQINFTLDKKNLSQKAFSDLLEKNESEISKWLSGNHNFTLKSLAKIESVLDEQILFTREEIVKRFLPYLFRQIKSSYSEEHLHYLINYFCLSEEINKDISFLLPANKSEVLSSYSEDNEQEQISLSMVA
jgi:transcriptional regulator with XRE-family HTH domain